MSAKGKPIKTTNTKKRINILTPPPTKGVVISSSVLDKEDITDDESNNTDTDTDNETSVHSDDEIETKTEPVVTSPPFKTRNGDSSSRSTKDIPSPSRSTRDSLPSPSRHLDTPRLTRDVSPAPPDSRSPGLRPSSRSHDLRSSSRDNLARERKSPIKGSVITAENVLAKYGYKAMEKLVKGQDVLYIRCVNTNGHTIFCDMQDSDYINENEGNNVIYVRERTEGELGSRTERVNTGRESTNETPDEEGLSQEVKDCSYGCVETYIDGVLIIHNHNYITLTRDGHHFKPRETVYTRVKTSNDFNAKSDQLIPFPIVSFRDICENSAVTDNYVYTVIEKIYQQFYKEKEKRVGELTVKLDKLYDTVVTSYENILEKIKNNIQAINLLEDYKAKYDKKETHISPQNRANLKSVVINLRITNSIERENITALTTLGEMSSRIDELIREVEVHKDAYDKTIESLDKKMER